MKGDAAELAIASDLTLRGYRVALPFGSNWDYDLLLVREPGSFERVQVKYTESDGQTITVRCRSFNNNAGKVSALKRYTSDDIDWLAVYDRTSQGCFYVPVSELGAGKYELRLRLMPTANGQREGVRWAADYKEI